MTPLTPQDPLWKLLGKAREAEVRGHFTQDVVRLARQTPQETGWLARLKAWFAPDEAWSLPRVAFAALPVLAAMALGLAGLTSETSAPATIAQAPAAAPVAGLFPEDAAFEVTEQWQSMEEMTDLLAVEDTATLTDREIAMLLY
jgi:hypothetical protein